MKNGLLQSLIFALIPLSLFFCLYKIVSAEDLSSMLKGRILLQVESHGEAWYINPANSQRYYLGRPADAFNLMRTLGLGVSNADFTKFNGAAPKNLAGRILLKVQDKGQAYYVNPTDLKLYYLGRPADAFGIMRKLGLGISNKNLEKITLHSESNLIGGQKDEHGCLSPAGYSWCPSTQKCQRMWEEYCSEYKEQYKGDQTNDNNLNTATSTDIIATSTNSDDSSSVSTSTATSTLAACDFKGEYFRNTNLIGSPNLTIENEKLNFDWGKSLGPVGLGRNNNFSARWTASCNFDAANYKFTAIFDDGMIVYVDGMPVISSWRDNVLTKTMEKEIEMAAGSHDIKVEYYKLENFGVAKLSWAKVQ